MSKGVHMPKQSDREKKVKQVIFPLGLSLSSSAKVKGKDELVESLRQLLGNTEYLEARQRAAKQVFCAVSKGVVEKVWDLVNAYVLKDKF